MFGQSGHQQQLECILVSKRVEGDVFQDNVYQDNVFSAQVTLEY